MLCPDTINNEGKCMYVCVCRHHYHYHQTRISLHDLYYNFIYYTTIALFFSYITIPIYIFFVYNAAPIAIVEKSVYSSYSLCNKVHALVYCNPLYQNNEGPH